MVSGGPERIPEVLSIVREEGIEIEGNPDVYVKAYRQFGIDEARELRERASLRALEGRRVFIIAAPDLNREAQNALLKMLEEPPGNALFFFILPSPGSLLPTLRSRVQLLRMSDIHTMDVGHPYIDAKTFLASTPEKRIDMLKPLLEKGDDEKRDLGAILAFLSSLEGSLAGGRDGIGTAHGKGVEAVYRARKFMTDKGALVKPLLEQVALLVPRM